MTVAHDVIWPDSDEILVRVVFLYVGQGDSALVLVKSGSTFKTVLVDINRDEKNGGIDVPRLVQELLEDEGGELSVFLNTHPHDDHTRDVVELSDVVDILEVWHSGHKPSKKHETAHKNLKKVIDKVKKKHGDDAETILLGSRSQKAFGDAFYYVLSPAKHITDEIDDETEEQRRRRIHEQCVVIKFGKDNQWVMLDGDADRDAFEKNITEYHKERLPANVLSASHHGSRSFFRYDKDDDPYKDALEAISPEYVVVSAPKQDESPHGHPHDDAIEMYEDEVGKDNVLHSGKNRECYIFDIKTDSTIEYQVDIDLVDEYGFDNDNNDDDSEKASLITSKKGQPKKAVRKEGGGRYA